MAFHGNPGWVDPRGRGTYTVDAVAFETGEKFEVLLEKRHDGHERYLTMQFNGDKIVFERDAIEDLKLFLGE